MSTGIEPEPAPTGISPVTLPVMCWGCDDAEQRALLVHGFCSCADTFSELAEGLARHDWFVTAVDLRGHGKAPRASSYSLEDYASDIEHVVRSDGKPWDLVVGHSIGAAVCVLAAAQKPIWSRCIGMLDPALCFPFFDMGFVNKYIESCQTETVESVCAKEPHWSMSVVKAKIEGQRLVDVKAIEQTIMSNSLRDLRGDASQLQMPMLIIAGADPSRGSLASGWARALAEKHEHITFQCLEGVGHNPHRDYPDKVLDLFRQWVQQIRPTP